MRTILPTICFLMIFAQSAFASITVTSTQLQVESSGMVNPGLSITGLTPWDFTAQNILGLSSIDEISVTLTLLDGDTGISEFDEGELVLELDGLNTGLALNGFANNVTMFNYTVSGANQSTGLLNALHQDGTLLGRILDLSPNDNYVKVRGGYMASLTLTDHGSVAVPAPSAVLLSGLGVIVAGWFKHKKQFWG